VRKTQVRITKVLPIVLSKSIKKLPEFQGFPVGHYSYSMFTLACTNPVMFKIRYVNGDVIDTTTSVSAVLGNAVHKALQAYLGGEEDYVTPAEEGEAIKHGHARGLEYLNAYSDGFISWTEAMPTRAKLEEKYAFCYFGYIKDFQYQKRAKKVLIVDKMLKYRVEVEGQNLPIPLKGAPDFVYEDYEGRVCIEDHKITGLYSKDEDIDGSKLIQAAFMYFLVYAETGKVPYSITFREFKSTKNNPCKKDKCKESHDPQGCHSQTKPFRFVYSEIPILFELFYRLYGDITDLLMGKAVFLPNVRAMFEKEVSILAYIYRLDVGEERNQAFKRMKVENLTDFLKEKIQKEGSLKKYMETVEASFISASTLNYKDMKIEERIKMKMAEHGLGIEFHSKVEGYSVDLYRYEPSIGVKMSKIEAYSKDIEQVVEVSGIRILAPIADSGLIGYEVPRTDRRFPTSKPKGDGFNLAIGIDIQGNEKRIDIREAPHMLVCGSSGSGKSIFLNCLIEQLLRNNQVELHLFDPKQVELFQYEGRKGVVQYAFDHEEINTSLEGLVLEMESRYSTLKKLRVKNIEGTDMKYKIVIIDEYADLVVRGEIGNSIQLLAQKGRACGIHLIIATQRASTKIVSGDIKINFLTKVIFKVSKAIDSRVVIDEDGAEKLLGKGDMLLSTADGIVRLQGYNL